MRLAYIGLISIAFCTAASGAPKHQSVKAKSLPVFSFMGQTTDEARTMDALNGSPCTVEGPKVHCADFRDPELGGATLSFLTMDFYNDRLYMVIGSAKKWASPKLLEAFTAKYGPPSITSEKWQNAMGTVLDNPVYTWHFKGGRLELDTIGSRIDDTDFTFTGINGPPKEPAKVDF